jgi:hypothetical protein
MKNMFKSILAFSSLAVLLVAYQNCGGTGDFGSLRKQSNLDSFSFPVKLEADYIGTMSCAGIPQDKISSADGFFTVKVKSDSSFSRGGIALEQDFIGHVENERQKRPANFHLPSELERALQASDKLQYASPQLSLLNRNSPSASVLDQRGVYLSKVYSSLQLDRQDIIDRLKYKSDGSSIAGYDFDMRFDLRKYDRQGINEIMSSLSGGPGLDVPAVLGLNFQSEKGNYGQYVRSTAEFEDESVGGVYGRLFHFNYSQNRLYGVVERESVLRNGTHPDVQGKSWSCKQIKIVRPTERDEQDSQCLNSAMGDSWRALGDGADMSVPHHRAMLGLLGDKWLTNKARDCVIHVSYKLDKDNPNYGCYGEQNLAAPVSYHTFLSSETTTLNAQYLSVCWANH